MKTETIKKFRDTNKVYTVECGDAQQYHHNLQGNYIIWNDAQEEFYSIRFAEDGHFVRYEKNGGNVKPYEVNVVNYDIISRMIVKLDAKELNDKYISKLNIDSETKEKMLKEFK